MDSSLRVPMREVSAQLALDDGGALDVTLFLTEGERVEDLFERHEAFVPVVVEGRVRLYARAAIACLSERGTIRPPPEDLVQSQRQVVVRLRGGTAVAGEVRYVPDDGRRLQEVLNLAAKSFTVHGAGGLHHVAKAHVVCVEET